MAQSIVCDVFDIPEMLGKIIWGAVYELPLDEAIARLCTLKLVHRLWLAAATGKLQICLKACLKVNASMERRIGRFLRVYKSAPRVDMLEAYARVRARSYWTEMCCDQGRRGHLFPIVPNGETYDRLEKVLRFRKPRCVRELWNQCSQICYCCGKVCTTGDDDFAVMLHPFAGHVRPCAHPRTGTPLLDENGEDVCYMQTVVLPHTNPAEFVSVCFQRDDTDGHYFTTVCTGPALSLSEKHYRNFVYAAKHEPWYEENIARMFALRPKELQRNSIGRRNCNYFMTNLPLQPLIINVAPDASVAEIFGRTRQEMRKLIAMGGRMRKEDRLMD